jgi:hypothetical protein
MHVCFAHYDRPGLPEICPPLATATKQTRCCYDRRIPVLMHVSVAKITSANFAFASVNFAFAFTVAAFEVSPMALF